jgi:hypothetical protein
MKTIDIICPACNAVSKWKVPITPVIFGCCNCHRNFETDARGHFKEQPAFTKRISEVVPDWFIPEARVDIDQRQYTVIALYCNGVNWQEWDSEAGWESGYGEYLEWYLVSSDGKELWLEESDQSNYLDINEYTNLSKEHINAVNNTVDRPEQIKEVGRYGLVAFRGIDDEPLDRGTWNYKVIQSATGDVSVEWQDQTPADQWRAFATKKSIRKIELERGRVRDSEELAALKEQTKHLEYYRDIFGCAALVVLVLMAWSWLANRNEHLFREAWIFSTQQTPTSNSSATRELGTAVLKSGVPYRFETICVFDVSNAEADFDITVLQMPEGRPVNAFAASFFSETGRDDEGAWTEATLSDYFQFTVDHDGEYLIEARLAPVNNSGMAKSGTLTVAIAPVVLSRYFIIFFLAMVLSWLILQWQWENIAIKSKSNVSGWLLRLFGK